MEAGMAAVVKAQAVRGKGAVATVAVAMVAVMTAGQTAAWAGRVETSPV